MIQQIDGFQAVIPVSENRMVIIKNSNLIKRKLQEKLSGVSKQIVKLTIK